MVAIVVVPVAFVWKSTKLDVGFNIAITIFLVLSSLACACFVLLLGGGGISAFNRRRNIGSDSGESVRDNRLILI